MAKCAFCEKDVIIPFLCSYCSKNFCSEHHLPEKHQCQKLPKEPKFWYHKRKLVEKRALLAESRIGICSKCGSAFSEMIDYDAKTMTFECKKCGKKWIQQKSLPHRIAESKGVFDFKAEPRKKPQKQVSRDEVVCPKCGKSIESVTSIEKEKVNYQCRKCRHQWFEQRLVPFTIQKESKKLPPRKPSQQTSLSGRIFAIIIGSLISVGGMAIVLWELYNPWFWTIFFVSFIPIPLIVIGIGILIFGFLVAVAGALQK